MKQIIYILSALILLILFILLKKKEYKVDFIKYIIITIVLFLCYNSAICLLLSSLCIPITLLTLSIINIIISIIILFIIIKEKTIQQYYVKIKNIIAIIFISIIAISIALTNFSSKLNIKYITTDAAVHYKAAKVFYQNDKLLNKIENKEIDKQFMTGAYTNTGILFKVFDPLIEEVNLYKLFIIFDIFIYILVGLVSYLLVEKLIKTKLSYILSLLFVTLYIIGYPLNSLIFGYVYLQLGILIIETIVIIFQEMDEKLNKNFSIYILLLLNLELFFSYLIFVPVLYATEGIYLLMIQYKKNKKYFSKENITTILISLIIPFIIGMLYFALPQLFKEEAQELFITIEGYIYRNYWSNFIVLVPISILCLKEKNKDIQFLQILFITLILIMIIMFISIFKFNFSTYYYCKFNFILWFVLWYGILYTTNIYINNKKFKNILLTYAIIYTILALLLINVGTKITKKVWNKETIANAFDIYGINKTVIKTINEDYTQEEMELIKYIYNNIDVKSNKILILGNPRQEYWFDSIFEYKNRKDLQTYIPESDIEKWNANEKYNYMLVLYDSYAYTEYKDKYKERKVLYENASGIIYENQ